MDTKQTELERLARIIDPDAFTVQMHDHFAVRVILTEAQDEAMDTARTVLKALRMPTEAMINAAAAPDYHGRRPDPAPQNEYARREICREWQAIDRHHIIRGTDMSELERLARVNYETRTGEKYHRLVESSKEGERKIIRAILEAMEPTEEMVKVADELQGGIAPHRDVFKAMISSILKEPE